jgi:WD40 repeat protein/serine/threonine protein kinase
MAGAMNNDLVMNGCASQELLRAFVAGGLNPDRSTEVAVHLAVCTSCQDLADALTEDSQIRELGRAHREGRMDLGSSASISELCEQLYALAPAAERREEAPRTAYAGESSHPSVLGRFRLLDRLGAGGFGVVYLAEDTQLNRRVALKLPRAGSLADPDASERFVREMRAAAALHHPQIVAVYDAGQQDGVYFLAAAYCPGATLQQWMQERGGPAAPEDAAAIVLALAEAAHHAHERGVLHRDIKPQNVLLDPTSRFRELPFCPKLTDFSVAKLLENEADATATNVLVGTPRYMAPEQVAGRRDLLGPPCDVYALGVVLYELLTGEPPIRGDNNADTLRRVLQDEPVSPRKLAPAIPGDLEAICLKCLEKSPPKRYSTAREVAEDLDRFLQGQPTRAHPLSPAERIARWIRRRPAAAGLLAVGIAGAFLLIGGLLLYNARLNDFNSDLGKANADLQDALTAARESQAKATQSDNRTHQLLYVSDMRLAARAWKDGDSRSMADFLGRHIPHPGETDRRGLEWRFLSSRAVVEPEILDEAPGDIYHLEVSPDGASAATAGKDATVRLYNLARGKLGLSIPTGQGEVNGVCFSPDGQRLATGGDDGTVRVWSRNEGRELLSIAAHPGHVMDVQFTPDGATLISCGKDALLHVWDAATGDERAKLDGRDRGTFSVDIAPDGKTLASASWGGTELWHLSEGRPRLTIGSEDPDYIACCIAFSPDGRVVALADMAGDVTIFDAQTGHRLAAGGHLDPVICVAFSQDGRYLASTDGVGTIFLWDLSAIDLTSPSQTPAELTPLRQWPGHQGRAYTASFTRDGRLLTSGADGVLRSWRVADLLPPQVAFADGGFGRPVFFDDGRLLVAGRGQLVEWTPASDPGLKRGVDQPFLAPLLASDGAGKLLATANHQGEVELWDRTRGKRLQRWSFGVTLSFGDVCLSPDGLRLAILAEQSPKIIQVFRTSDGHKIHSVPAPQAALGHFCFSPDGSQLAFKADDEVVRWEFGSNVLLRSPPDDSHGGSLNDLAYHPDGSLLATCASDRFVKFWDPRSGKLLAELSSHLQDVTSLAFSPDGRTLLTVDAGGVLKMWNVAAREELFELQLCEDGVSRLSISHDGRWLAATTAAKRLLLLDLGSATLPGQRSL